MPERGAEMLALEDALNALERLIVEKHPYDTPEFIALPIGTGNKCYLAWLSQSVKDRFT